MSDTVAPPLLIETISRYWCELLKLEEVRPDDDFITLGGNSLLATMLANRIDADMGIRPDMIDLFSTVKHVASICDNLITARQT